MRLGFVIKDGFNELLEIKLKHLKRRFSNEQIHLTIFPTLRCNFDCIYCYENLKRGDMSKRTINNLKKFVKKCVSENKFELFNTTWMGGEPTLRIDIIKDLTQFFKQLCKDNNMKYSSSLVTNGYLLSNFSKKQLINWSIENIQITIDGTKDVNDKRRIAKDGGSSYENAVYGMEKLIMEGYEKFSIRANVDKTNINNMEDFINVMSTKFSKHEIPIIFATVDDDTGTHPELNCTLISNEDFREINDNLCDLLIKYNMFFLGAPMPKGYACQAYGFHNYVISPEGYLLKCNHDICSAKEKAFGSVNSNEINYDNLMRYMDEDIFKDEECIECKYLPICMGYCIYLRENRNQKKCLVKEICLNKRVWYEGYKNQLKGGEKHGDSS